MLDMLNVSISGFIGTELAKPMLSLGVKSPLLIRSKRIMTEYIKAKEYLKAQCEKRKDSLVLEMPQNYITDVEQAFIDGYHEGFKDCAKSRLNVTTISDCPILCDFVVQYERGVYKYKDKLGRAFESVDGETWKEIVPPKEIE
jgi:hypothetical protein